ncbi:hypothetical protein [Sulfitobacter albidus]|uniref:hypothetical protein n=1 Tax=Sulfitobacter albidus TaxID=2829501 RepID=UPI0020C914F8|nr:hypothetical protein [Sulfitobacter albidus]
MRVLLIFLCLAACNTAGPHFRGLPATQVTVEGSVFDVRVRDELAEAIRTNPQYAPRFGPIKGRMAVAMAQVSGCEVREVRGDQAQAIGILKCGKGPAKPIPRTPVDLDCVPVRGTGVKVLGGLQVEIECTPVL